MTTPNESTTDPELDSWLEFWPDPELKVDMHNYPGQDTTQHDFLSHQPGSAQGQPGSFGADMAQELSSSAFSLAGPSYQAFGQGGLSQYGQQPGTDPSKSGSRTEGSLMTGMGPIQMQMLLSGNLLPDMFPSSQQQQGLGRLQDQLFSAPSQSGRPEFKGCKYLFTPHPHSPSPCVYAIWHPTLCPLFNIKNNSITTAGVTPSRAHHWHLYLAHHQYRPGHSPGTPQ